MLVFALTGCKSIQESIIEVIDEKATTLSGLRSLENKYGDVLDFDSIYAGATCLTGKQTSTQKTEKYGLVTIEFSYCKSNESYYIHIYN